MWWDHDRTYQNLPGYRAQICPCRDYHQQYNADATQSVCLCQSWINGHFRQDRRTSTCCIFSGHFLPGRQRNGRIYLWTGRRCCTLERIQSGHLRTALDNSGHRRGERDNIWSARLFHIRDWIFDQWDTDIPAWQTRWFDLSNDRSGSYFRRRMDPRYEHFQILRYQSLPLSHLLPSGRCICSGWSVGYLHGTSASFLGNLDRTGWWRAQCRRAGLSDRRRLSHDGWIW